MSSSDLDDEAHLFNHIKNILTDYVCIHITVDHIQYTSDLVCEIIENDLRTIPTCELNQVSLQNDPFEVLKARANLVTDNYAILNETLEQGTEVAQLLKSVLKIDDHLRSQKVWVDEMDDYSYLPLRPMSPLLSRSSKNETPELGTIYDLNAPLCKHLISNNIQTISNEDTPNVEQEKLEDHMDVKIDVDISARKLLYDHQKYYESLSRQANGYLISTEAKEFLKVSPPSYVELLRPLSPPLFPRDSCKRLGKESTIVETDFYEVVKKARLEYIDVEDEAADQANENMSIIDGWCTLATSDFQTSTPSLAPDDSGVDELDDMELWKLTPSSNDHNTLYDMYMDPPIFPRSDHPAKGYRLQPTNDKEQEQDFSTFISSHLFRYPGSTQDELAFDNNMDSGSNPLSLPLNSGLPSELASIKCVNITDTNDQMLNANDLFELDIYKFLGNLTEISSLRHKLIMDEHLDEKESMFLDVPSLPPASTLYRAQRGNSAESLSQFLLDIKNIDIHGKNSGSQISVNLRKVTGLKSLNIELSWRPFTFGLKVPTHSDLLDTDISPFKDSTDVALQHDIDSLLDLATLELSIDENSSFSALQTLFHTDLYPEPARNFDAIEIDTTMVVLSRLERNVNFTYSYGVDTISFAREEESSEVLCEPSDGSYVVGTIPNFQQSKLVPITGDSSENLSNEWPFPLPDRYYPVGLDENLYFSDDETAPQGEQINYSDSKSQYFSADLTTASDSLNLSETPFNTIVDWVSTEENSCQWLPQDIHTLPRITTEDHLDYINTYFGGENSLEDPLYPDRGYKSDLIPDVHVEPKSTVENYKHRLLSESLSLSSYLCLRGKSLFEGVKDNQPNRQPDERDSTRLLSQEMVHPSAPRDLLKETRALELPVPWSPPRTRHSYLIPTGLLQQRALIQRLESSQCVVHLIAREIICPIQDEGNTPQVCSADISIIVDPHSGVVFFPLSALPSQINYASLLKKLSLHSSRFSRILLILLSFPTSRLTKFENTLENSLDGPCAYSPPVLKAVKRIRRDLGLREGTGEMRPECRIELAFADKAEEVALYIRLFGDLVHQKVLMDYSPYLSDDEQEGENDLSQAEGMNAFCAALILSCYSFDEFLYMAPDIRIQEFANLLGREKIEKINILINSRMKAITVAPLDV